MALTVSTNYSTAPFRGLAIFGSSEERPKRKSSNDGHTRIRHAVKGAVKRNQEMKSSYFPKPTLRREHDNFLYVFFGFYGCGAVKNAVNNNALDFSARLFTLSHITNAIAEMHARGINYRKVNPTSIYISIVVMTVFYDLFGAQESLFGRDPLK